MNLSVWLLMDTWAIVENFFGLFNKQPKVQFLYFLFFIFCLFWIL